VSDAVRRPCSDFMDMLRRLINYRIIIIIIIKYITAMTQQWMRVIRWMAARVQCTTGLYRLVLSVTARHSAREDSSVFLCKTTTDH